MIVIIDHINHFAQKSADSNENPFPHSIDNEKDFLDQINEKRINYWIFRKIDSEEFVIKAKGYFGVMLEGGGLSNIFLLFWLPLLLIVLLLSKLVHLFEITSIKLYPDRIIISHPPKLPLVFHKKDFSQIKVYYRSNGIIYEDSYYDIYIRTPYELFCLYGTKFKEAQAITLTLNYYLQSSSRKWNRMKA